MLWVYCELRWRNSSENWLLKSKWHTLTYVHSSYNIPPLKVPIFLILFFSIFFSTNKWAAHGLYFVNFYLISYMFRLYSTDFFGEFTNLLRTAVIYREYNWRYVTAWFWKPREVTTFLKHAVSARALYVTSVTEVAWS